eukprot:11451215-Ditylum_brightwellii.AAC.1
MQKEVIGIKKCQNIMCLHLTRIPKTTSNQEVMPEQGKEGRRLTRSASKQGGKIPVKRRSQRVPGKKKEAVKTTDATKIK